MLTEVLGKNKILNKLTQPDLPDNCGHITDNAECFSQIIGLIVIGSLFFLLY